MRGDLAAQGLGGEASLGDVVVTDVGLGPASAAPFSSSALLKGRDSKIFGTIFRIGSPKLNAKAGLVKSKGLNVSLAAVK
ncbi:hypothetical protein [Kitasatospora sp. NPDC051164]|uniref:hypothetical protein n=1 Tax=Kitasatospora sp. NPDC051164 TaxID=3364055 RepID=UPI00379B3BF4